MLCITEIPVACTCWGSWGMARDTRFCTLTWSMLMSVSSSKYTWIVLWPWLVLKEEM